MYTKDKGFKFYDRIEKKKLFQIFKKILKKKKQNKNTGNEVFIYIV